MSGIIMHNHFAKVVYSGLKDEVKKEITNYNLYEYASNGIDSLLYINFFSKKNQKLNYDLCNNIYSRNTKAFLLELTKLAKLNKDLFPYLCGCVIHYYLDIFSMPYIYHKTGIYDLKVNNSIKYRGLHQKLLRAMDVYVLENYYNANANTYRINRKILKLKRLPKTIQPDINALYEKIYDINDAYKLLNKSIRWQKLYYMFIYDPIGLKNKLFSRIDNGKTIIDYNYLSYHNKGINIRKFDIFNFKHERWCNPVDDSIVSIDSYFDLFERAKKMSIDTISALYEMIFLDEEINLNNYFYDISLITGLPCDNNKEMKYFNNIFK